MEPLLAPREALVDLAGQQVGTVLQSAAAGSKVEGTSRLRCQLGARLVLILGMGITLLVLASKGSRDMDHATIGVLATTTGLFLVSFGAENTCCSQTERRQDT